jgi:hypothetical protein
MRRFSFGLISMSLDKRMRILEFGGTNSSVKLFLVDKKKGKSLVCSWCFYFCVVCELVNGGEITRESCLCAS